MGRLVEFPSAGGGSILVEVVDAGSVVTRGPNCSRLVDRAQQTFEDAVARVQPAVEGMITQLQTLAARPDEVRVEFGLDLHAEAGAFIAAGSTSANFKVALTWKRDGTGEA
ncbi:MAG: hypothetical protein EOP32_20545 [Rhodococcus sp. (in: high G+C Gram-positive bacteria)]|nr:MAG: hypothetical protein EOP32_20545 [Rhodococcus sp. (in: high G+C Gram-positive bacteria)]